MGGQLAKSYESLMGSIGRAMFYRPERQRVRELLSRESRPKLMVNGTEYPLFDMSMSGLSFLAHNGSAEMSVGDEADVLLLLHGEEIFSGLARVARVEPGPRGGSRGGLGLVRGFLDLPEIRRRDDEKQLDDALNEGHELATTLIPATYREVVARIVYFFQYYRRNLDYHEKRYRDEGADEEAITRLVYRATDALRQPWAEFQREASRAAVECLGDRKVLLAAKEFTETLLVPCMLDIPLNSRAYLKPLGYPGDYQVMLYYYADGYEGDTVFTKAMHKLHMEHPLANGVRTRKELIVRQMEEEHRRVIRSEGESATCRVTSLGCGPAREVSDFIARNRNWSGEIVWTLIDQEEEALSVAYRAGRRELSTWDSRGRLELLNLSFLQLLSEGLPLRDPGSQDFIYCTGLFDYIREERAQTLIKAMYELIPPGGLLMIGNALAPNEHFWTPEFLGDWTILYRTRDEVERLAALLPETADVDVIIEPGNAYYFLMLRKNEKG